MVVRFRVHRITTIIIEKKNVMSYRTPRFCDRERKPDTPSWRGCNGPKHYTRCRSSGCRNGSYGGVVGLWNSINYTVYTTYRGYCCDRRCCSEVKAPAATVVIIFMPDPTPPIVVFTSWPDCVIDFIFPPDFRVIDLHAKMISTNLFVCAIDTLQFFFLGYLHWDTSMTSCRNGTATQILSITTCMERKRNAYWKRFKVGSKCR